MESNKKTKVLMIISTLTLAVLVTGATFAYFTAQGGVGAQTNINVTTHTTDMLTFATSAPITITADQETFASGKGNREGTTTASATLRANSKTNSATEHYNLYLDITNNTFEYTTEAKTAELILTIKNPEGNNITNIQGLKYVTVNGVSGFDVTEYNNLITIANNKEITSTGTKIEEWEVTLTLINLDSNQNANTGKTFNASLMIQKEMILAQYIKNLYTTQGANNLYLHNGTITDAEGNIMDAEDGSYRYSGGDYKVAEAHKSEYETISDIIKFEVDPNTETNPSGYNRYYLVYDSDKTYYNNPNDVVSKALDDGYVEKNSVNNYVCFGSDAEKCPYENLYRIIGVFDNKVKLIKADYATDDQLGTDGDFIKNYNSQEAWLQGFYGDMTGLEIKDENPSKSKNSKYSSYFWNSKNFSKTHESYGVDNVWKESELNKTNLNINFLNNIGNEWSSKIATTTWYVGGMTESQAGETNAKEAYEYEIGKNKITSSPHEPHEAKVGLMYVSDYYYSTLSTYWTRPDYADDDNCINDECLILAGSDYSMAMFENWILMGDWEWTITRGESIPEYAFAIMANMSGLMGVYYVSDVDYGALVRPTFYLNRDIKLAGGSGTQTDPYRIK